MSKYQLFLASSGELASLSTLIQVASSTFNAWKFAGHDRLLPLPPEHDTTTSIPLSSKRRQLVPMDVDFPRFPELPYDIRAIVWHHAAHERRVLKVAPPMYYPQTKSTGRLLRPTTRHPGLLGACRESRQIGLRYYEAIRQQCCYRSLCGDHSGRIIYFNNNTDTIHGDLYSAHAICETIENIRWLQLDSDGPELNHWIEFNPKYIKSPVLESLVFFHDGDITDWESEILEPGYGPWGCSRKIIKVFGRDGETYDFKKDYQYMRSIGAWDTDSEFESDAHEDA